jgi:DNA repair exonuclease SbcCD nuclease subunit
MKFVLTADIQLHPHQLWSKILPNGINSRLQNGIDCLEQAFKLAQGGILVINGDLFHDRKHIPIEALHAVSEVFEKYSDVPTLINIGNHDQCLRDGRIHSTKIFSGFKNVTVIDRPHSLTFGKTTLHIHPFTTKLEDFKEWASSLNFSPSSHHVMVVHQEVEGSLLAKGMRYKGGLSLGDLRCAEVDAVFLGHFHRPQTLADNAWYIGSPYEVDAGEAGDEKRFMVFSDSGGKCSIESIPVVGMPKHVRWANMAEFEAGGDISDFNTVECTSRDEAQELEVSGCKSVMKSQESLSAEGISVGDVSIEEAIRLSCQSKGRDDLVDKIKTRLGI